ncbi:serine protease SP24D-like [Eurosta solidaginis]|uniref:serine protease SP24D-like n=1 Tax=Eurosta solidaginis TaxID=178769 RepID=UPI00353085A3
MNPLNNFALLFVLLSCFLTHTNTQNRIINGGNISIERSPHSVAILHQNVLGCAGSLVSMNSVVTAAYCVLHIDATDIKIVAGVTDLRQINREQRRNVHSIHNNDDEPETRYLSVAVVKVDIPFEETDRVKSILLCEAPLVAHSRMKISGWGSINADSEVPCNRLKSKSVQVGNTQQCRTIFANRQPSVNLPDTIICAGRGADLGAGDNGAGGVLNSRLCAVAQLSCTGRYEPDLYTNVTIERVRNFITSMM